jgi:diguanylate cyclase (GGDEF)-like protein
VTGAADDEAARKKALDLGATDFIGKPFGSIDLLARARAHSNYRRIAKKLEQQITHDPLTGLPNRAGLLERLQQDLAYAKRHSQPLSLMRIEIDDFKRLFLAHGKVCAEALIQHVARILEQRVRKEDTAARIGLASFALVLPAGQHLGSKGLAEAQRKQLQDAPVLFDGSAIALTMSAVVTTPKLIDTLAPAEMLEEGEPLLQAAMQAGGNRVVAASSGDQAPAESRAPPASSDAPARKGAAMPAQSAATSAPQAVASAPVLVDEALQHIERGESQSVLGRQPQQISRLLPLLRLLNAKQRAQLIAYLQKLGA